MRYLGSAVKFVFVSLFDQTFGLAHLIIHNLKRLFSICGDAGRGDLLYSSPGARVNFDYVCSLAAVVVVN